MTLEEFISQHKLRGHDDYWVYIALYNKDNHRFYGAFVNSEYLDPYLKMEVLEGRKVGSGSAIYEVQLKDYEYNLGLGSMQLIWDKEKKAEENRKNKKY